MAYRNKILKNPGMTIRFLQTANDTNGELLEMESTYYSNSGEPPVHYHPFQTEYFSVLSGEITVRINNEVRIMKEGESFVLEPGIQHSMWNKSGDTTVLNWKVMPAMNTETLFEILNGLQKDGRPLRKGIRGLLQISLTANKFSAVFRLAKPPFFIQKIIYSILTPFAWLAGYRAVYKEYID
ncbi:MAG: cupin domain-containing protein [Bacteroidota bacterium]